MTKLPFERLWMLAEFLIAICGAGHTKAVKPCFRQFCRRRGMDVATIIVVADHLEAWTAPWVFWSKITKTWSVYKVTSMKSR
jgi:hypothetical protein